MPWHEPVEQLQREVESIEQRLDKQINLRLNQIDVMLERLQRRLFWGSLTALLGLLIAALAIYFVALGASHTANQVAYQRRATIYQNCTQQNQRNANTIAVLNRVVAQYEKHPQPGVTKKQLQGSIQANIALINALDPHQNCAALVAHQAPRP